MMKTPIKITGGKGCNKQYKQHFKKYKLTFKDGAWVGEVNRWDFKRIRRFCMKNHLCFFINTDFGKRSNTYRHTFFKYTLPFFKNYYVCAYCGKPLKRNKLTVDHIYPVSKVDKSQILQEKLRKMGATSVNSYQNLVASCYRCNMRKGTEMGIWVTKARLGKSYKLWIIRWLIKYTIIGIIGYSLLYFFCHI